MTVKYSSRFRANYEKLPLDVQRRFFFVDAAVLKGDLSRLRAEPFDRYVAYLDAKHAAYGKLIEVKPKKATEPNEETAPKFVFLWIFIGGKEQVPVIL